MRKTGRRSRLSTILMILAAVLTIGIIVFFLLKMVTHNPLAGTWYSEEEGITIVFKDESKVTISGVDKEDAQAVNLDFLYETDRENKTITLELFDKEQQDTIHKTGKILRENSLEDSLRTMETEFEFSIQGNKLTLMEREYGDTIELLRK